MFVLPVASPYHRRAAPAYAHLWSRCGSATAADDETRTPRIDVVETDAAYSVVLDMPGVAKERLNVSVEGRRVQVRTTAPEAVAADADNGTRTLYRERSSAPYARTIVLPAEVDNAQSQARFENGVLTLTLAKRVAAGASQIPIN